ncbi:MAG: IS701 family transposase [Actinobacteria bacterium]|nr:IS701 family transposase [Actinomycetota bacterium]
MARASVFALELFAPMERSDQRGWGCAYLRGLMLDGRRKSIQPMAERLPDGDEQCLQQFVNQSPWEWAPVRERLARRMETEIAPEAWIIDDTGFPKAGRFSVGVAPQYCGALGKVANCQVGVSISAASDRASCPLDWRVYLPESWDRDRERRAKAHLPAEIRYLPKWKLALEMLDELRAWGLAAKPVLADSAFGEVGAFRSGLTERGLRYCVQVKGDLVAQPAGAVPVRPPYRGRGRPPKPRYQEDPRSLRALALAADRTALVEVSWREGVRGELRSCFGRLAVRPAGEGISPDEDGVLARRTLLYEWPEGKLEPVKYWLTDLPEDTDLAELARLAKLRWRIEHDYRELKDALGLDHFEGRSYRGWNHHTTLVSVAHGFLTLERLRLEAAGPPAGERPAEQPEAADPDEERPRPFVHAA